MPRGPHKPTKTRPAQWSELCDPFGPHVFARICPERERPYHSLARYGQPDVDGRRVFQVRGRKVVPSRLIDEIGAAIGLRDDAAGNSHAMVEHLEDLYTYHPAQEFVFVFVDAHVVPALDYWITVMSRAGERYAEAIRQGAWFDRPAMPFHCVLEVDSDEQLGMVCREVWRELGERTPVPVLGPSPFTTEDPAGEDNN